MHKALRTFRKVWGTASRGLGLCFRCFIEASAFKMRIGNGTTLIGDLCVQAHVADALIRLLLDMRDRNSPQTEVRRRRRVFLGEEWGFENWRDSMVGMTCSLIPGIPFGLLSPRGVLSKSRAGIRPDYCWYGPTTPKPEFRGHIYSTMGKALTLHGTNLV